jgi:hypothetical protein
MSSLNCSKLNIYILIYLLQSDCSLALLSVTDIVFQSLIIKQMSLGHGWNYDRQREAEVFT